MYRNPRAGVNELQEAVIRIAKEVRNTYFAPVIKVKDIPVLAISNHFLFEPLYYWNYPTAYFVRCQVEAHMAGKNLGAEIERMCTTGSVTPRHWMQKAVGAPLSTKPLLDAVDNALKIIKK